MFCERPVQIMQDTDVCRFFREIRQILVLRPEIVSHRKRRGVQNHLAPELGSNIGDNLYADAACPKRRRLLQPMVDGVSDERGRHFKLIVDDVSA